MPNNFLIGVACYYFRLNKKILNLAAINFGRGGRDEKSELVRTKTKGTNGDSNRASIKGITG